MRNQGSIYEEVQMTTALKLNDRQTLVLAYIQKVGGEPSTADIATKLHLSISGVQQVLQSLAKLNLVVSTGGSGAEEKWAIIERAKRSDEDLPQSA